jgi:hypothetical protein
MCANRLHKPEARAKELRLRFRLVQRIHAQSFRQVNGGRTQAGLPSIGKPARVFGGRRFPAAFGFSPSSQAEARSKGVAMNESPLDMIPRLQRSVRFWRTTSLLLTAVLLSGLATGLFFFAVAHQRVVRALEQEAAAVRREAAEREAAEKAAAEAARLQADQELQKDW